MKVHIKLLLCVKTWLRNHWQKRGFSRALDSGKPEKNLQGQGIHHAQILIFFIHFVQDSCAAKAAENNQRQKNLSEQISTPSVQGVPISMYLTETLSKMASNHVFSFNRDSKIAQDAEYQQAFRILCRKSYSRLFLGSEGSRHAVFLHSSACGCNNSELC